jgi:hypothetical protein
LSIAIGNSSGVNNLSRSNVMHGSGSESHSSVSLHTSSSSGSLGSILSILSGNTISDLSGLGVWLVNLAVRFVLERLDSLQVKNKTTVKTLKASLVP